MTLLTAPLTTDEYTSVRGDHSCLWLVAMNPNTVMFKAQINQASFGNDFAQVTFDNVTVGTYSGVKEGWTVYLSHTDNIYESYFRGRVRKPLTSSILYINQTSAPAADNDYIFIVKDTGLHERLPRKAGSTLYWDYDKPYNQMGPQRASLPSYMVAKLSESGVARFDFAPGTYSPVSGRTITDHLWDPDGGTFHTGTETDEDVTIEFDAPGWYEVRHTAADSADESNFFAVRVVVYAADYSAGVTKSLIPEGASYDPALGWSTRLRVGAGDDLVEVLNETEVVIFSEDVFENTRTSLVTNIKVAGRIRRDDTSVDLAIRSNLVQVTSETSVEVEGIGSQLSRLILASMTLRRKSPATVLGQIDNLTLWRGMSFLASIMTTFTTTHSLDFDDKTNDYAYPLFTAQDRSAESALSDVAFTINAYFNWSPDGRVYIARHMHYQNATDKAALMTVANFAAVDYGKLDIRHDPVPRLGRVIGYGGSYNTTSGATIALRAKAPSVVWGTGEGRSQLNRQVLKANLSLAAAKNEIAVRTGAEYAAKNLVYTLDVEHPSGYDTVLFPTVYQRYTWTIAAGSNRRGFACDTSKYWWLQRVQIRYTPPDPTTGRGGFTRTSATYIEDITGINAQVMAEIAPQDKPAYIPTLPPLLSTPFTGLPSLLFPTGIDIDPNDEQPYTEEDAEQTQKPPEKSTDPDKPAPTPEQDPKTRAGAVVAISNGSSLWICEDFTKKATPTWKNITPGSAITDFRFDPHTGGGWAITNDGINSIVWRADNILNPNWRSTTLEGVWTQIRPTGSAGEVYIYSPSAMESGSSVTFDFTESDHGFVPLPVPAPTPTYANYFTGEGWARGADGSRLGIQKDLGETYVRAVFEFNENLAGLGDSFVSVVAYPYPPLTVVGIAGGVSDTYDIDYPATAGFACDLGIVGALIADTLRLTRLTLYTSDSPTQVAVRRSDDFGTTFGDPILGGDVPPAGTFDTQRLGTGVFAAGAAQVLERDGDSLEDAAGGDTAGTYARAIWATENGFLMASAAAVSGETLWTVVGAKSAITPNDGSNDGLVVGPYALATSPDEDLLLMLANFGGTVKLARSTNGGSSWSFTTGLNAAALAVRAKNAEQVYIANASAVAYSEDSGATLVQKTAPISSITILEVR